MKKSLLLSAAVIGVSTPAIAQEVGVSVTEANNKGSVVVTATRLDQLQVEAGTTIDVITSEEIEEQGYAFAMDAIVSSPSVTLNANGAFGGLASLRIRGATGGQSLVLVDGVPVGDPTGTDGAFNIAQFDAADIASIEILKGPQSTLWGSDAIGGVISIATKKPEQGSGGQVFAEVGSYSTLRGGASYEYGANNADFRLSVSGITSDGISKADEADGNTEDDGYESFNYAAKGGVNFAGNARAEAGLSYTTSEADIDGFGPVDAPDVTTIDELRGHARVSVPLGDKMTNEIYVGYADIDRFTAGAFSFGSAGDRWLYRYQGGYEFNNNNKISFGVEREDSSSGNLERQLDSLYGLYEVAATDTLTLTAGLRVDDHDGFGSHTTGRIAAAWNPTELITVRSTWGQGFKAPSIFQSTYICGFCGLTEPNSNLKPEEAEAFDIGVDVRSADGKAEFSLTVFDKDVTNQIDFSFTAGYDNIAQVEATGLELSARYEVFDWLSIYADYANLRAEDGSGNQLARLPRSSGDVRLAYTPEGPVSGSLLVRYNGEELDGGTTMVPAWTRVDLAGSYTLNDRVELYARVENLLDEEYQQVLGYGTPGLSGFAGVRVKY